MPLSLTCPWSNEVVVYLPITISLTGWIVPAWYYTFSADNHLIRHCEWWDKINTTGDFLYFGLYGTVWIWVVRLRIFCWLIILIYDWILFPCLKRKRRAEKYGRKWCLYNLFNFTLSKNRSYSFPSCFPRFLLLRVGRDKQLLDHKQKVG